MRKKLVTLKEKGDKNLVTLKEKGDTNLMTLKEKNDKKPSDTERKVTQT